jgi:hypothetical protein
MNKLREKIENCVFISWDMHKKSIEREKEKKAIQLEQITDDFTISFQIFQINNDIVFSKEGWCVFNNEHLTINELLQHFKTNIYENTDARND